MSCIKKLSFRFFSEKGLTLIEILVSITILSIIMISFLSFFVQTARMDSFSKTITNETYLAQANMEVIYNLISSIANSNSNFTTNMASLSSKITDNTNNYVQTVNGCPSGICFAKNSNDGHYLFVQIADAGFPLVNIKVKVFKDSSRTIQEAQMENTLTWNK